MKHLFFPYIILYFISEEMVGVDLPTVRKGHEEKIHAALQAASLRLQQMELRSMGHDSRKHRIEMGNGLIL